jgi:hypothetical protein
MQLIDYIFGILDATTPMTQKDSATLRAEIQADLDKVVTDKESEFYKPTLKAKVINFFRNPWIRLGMAASFLIVCKSLKDWYNGKFDKDSEE